MSNEIGDDCEISSLPDEARDDFVPSSSVDGDGMEGSNAPDSADARFHDEASSQEDGMQGSEVDGAGSEVGNPEARAGTPPTYGRSPATGSIVADVDSINARLLNASATGDCTAIRQLVATGASPNTVTPVVKGQEYCHVAMSPLHLAASGVSSS